MYRLLRLNRRNVSGLQTLWCDNSLGRKSEVNGYLCSFCQRQHFNGAIRKQSSTTKTETAKTGTSEKITDLLVVNNKVQEVETSVTNLNSNDLNILILSDLSLDQFYKLKDIKKNVKIVQEHLYNELTIIPKANYRIEDEIERKQVEQVNQQTEAPKKRKSDLEQQIDEEVIAIEKLKRPPRTSNPFDHQDDDLEDYHEHPETRRLLHQELATEEMVNRTLAIYVEICCYLNSPQRALNVILAHRNQLKRTRKSKLPALKSIHPYNIVLRAFATKSDYEKQQLVLNYIEEDKLELNVHSFVAIFECLGRLNVQNNHLREIRSAVKQMQKYNITFDDIMNRGKFSKEERDIVLTALRSYDDNYVPYYTKPSLQYNNPLVDSLNHPSQLDGLEPITKASNNLLSDDYLLKGLQKQFEVEKTGYITVKNVGVKPVISEDVNKYRQILNDHLKMWEKEASDAFARNLLNLNAQKNILNIEPFLRCLPAKEYIKIIIEEAKMIAQGSETYSSFTKQLHSNLGGNVFSRYVVLRKQKYGILDQIEKVHSDYCKYYANTLQDFNELPNDHIDFMNNRQKWQWCEYKLKGEGASVFNQPSVWFPFILQAVGNFLYDIIINHIRIDVNSMKLNSKHKNYLPAFYTVFRNQGRIVKQEVKPHPVLAKLFRASACETITFPTNEMPMYCPPIPWITPQFGGYLMSRGDFVRLPAHSALQRQRLRETNVDELYPSIDALNESGAVPWKINERILDAIIIVFNDGGSEQLEVPVNPNHLPPPGKIDQTMDKNQKFLLLRQHLQFKRHKSEMYSLWCDCLYKISIANHFRKKIFWLPHNMDFRGRLYPIPPHLNHLGADIYRSMLLFAQPRPLGPNGLDWLKIHAINLTGLLKRETIHQRLQYANEIINDILDSADNPLTGKLWWSQSENPWQTLACCMEIANAYRSPDPVNFLSHFPVHQDGSCNGLQHYAALGRDTIGAISVNLQNSPTPQDVYSGVVALVEQQRAIDAANGVEIAKILQGHVVRKVIKQTVMTTVYGVTRFGARLQIARQLKDLPSFPKEHIWLGSQYLTGRTFDSIRSMFTSTREIQEWLTECARLISSVCLKNMEWVTPLGLPVVQPYSKIRSLSNKNIYQSLRMDKYETPSTMKQKNAFPPNFIHSLDSSHMMLTSLYCRRQNVVFVSVHDCFWTHASTVPQMNNICREQFVALHSEPILENLSLYLNEKFSFTHRETGKNESQKQKLNNIILQLPKTGDFDIRHVIDSVYFFS